MMNQTLHTNNNIIKHTDITSHENTLSYDGKTKTIYGIWIENFLLSIITLGIYSFWGKTKMRRYIAHHFSLLDDRFEYHGTGSELFKGFLKILPLLILLNVFFLTFRSHALFAFFVTAIYILIFLLVIAASYLALRYRASRTTWRGIRGRLDGSAIKFTQIVILCFLIDLLSLGLLTPYTDMKIYRYVARHMSFGNIDITCEDMADNAGKKALFKTHIITWLLAIPTLSLSRFWYRAALIRFQYSHTAIDQLRLKSTYDGKSLMLLKLGNFAILILTLGLGYPIIIQRNLKYFAKNTFIIGMIDGSNIMQSDEVLSSSGEGLESTMGGADGFI